MTSEFPVAASSRGRGAGVNKPAWMVQKEREEALSTSESSNIVKESENGGGGGGGGNDYNYNDTAGGGDGGGGRGGPHEHGGAVDGQYADAERDQFGRVVSGGRVGGGGGSGGDYGDYDRRDRGGDYRGGGGSRGRDDYDRRDYRRDDDRRGGGGGGGARRGDDYYYDDRRSHRGGGGGRSSRSDRGDHRRGGGGSRAPPSSGIQFHSYEEERDWLNDRRRKRRGRKSLFDVEPTPEQLAEDEARAALEQNHALVRTGGAVAATGANIGLNSAVGNQRYGSTSGGSGGGGGGLTTTMMQPQQTRHARRLYIGNIPDLSEEEVHTFFRDAICNSIILDPNTNPNAASHRSQYVDNDPIISVYINRERRFVFLEFKTMEITTACLALDGIDVMGQGKVKVKRPNDYNAAMAPMINPATAPQLDISKLGIVSPTVPDGPNKIFIGGLPYHLTESQVLELLSAFGAVKAFHLVKQDANATTSKGYCFVEYADPNITQVACMGLQGMEMGGGKQLSCRMAAQQFAQQQGAMDQVGGAFGAPVPAPPVQASIVDGVDVDALLAAALGGGGGGGGAMPIVNPAAGLGPMGNMMVHHQQPLGVMPNQQMGMFPMGMMPQQQLYPQSQGLIVSDPLAVANAAASALDAAFGGGGSMAPMAVPSPAMVSTVQPSLSSTPTRILVLLNMVMDEDLSTEEDHKMLEEEVREEVSRYGKLVSMKIPRPQVSWLFCPRTFYEHGMSHI